MSTIVKDKMQLSSMYGEVVDVAAPEPTIWFGVNGSNAKWGTELQDVMNDMSKLTFIKGIADMTMSQICYNDHHISQIKAVTKNYPIFDTYEGRITKINKTNVKIVANWICHFIDPSILNIVTIQDMMLFMVYQFGYIDNLKAFVHYDFINYKHKEISNNQKFLCSEYEENLHFLDKRYTRTEVLKYDELDDADALDVINDFIEHMCYVYDIDSLVKPTDPVMDLVEVVASCCNTYYFKYGWHFHYPSFAVLTKCEIPEHPWNTYAVRKKLGLSNKDQKESHKQVTTNVSLLDIECIRTHMKMLCIRPTRYISTYNLGIMHTIFNRFLHQCKSSNDLLTPYDMIVFIDKCLYRDRRITYGDIMLHGLEVLHFVSTDVRYIQNRYVINFAHIVPLMRAGRLWPSFYDYRSVMNAICSSILDPLGKITEYRGRGYTKN